jgi:hypothetical protein
MPDLSNPTAEELLERLAFAREGAVLAEDELASVIAGILPPEVRKAIQEAEAELKPRIDEAKARIVSVEQVLKETVLMNGRSAKAAGLEAVFAAGRVSWDTKALDKAMALIPGLAEYRKQGYPYVTIRAEAKPPAKEDRRA